MKLSSKKVNIISLCFLFLLFSSIKCEPEKIPYSGEELLSVNSTATHQELDIVFAPTLTTISKYIKIAVYKLQGPNEAKNFVISVFSDEKRTNRIQMSQSNFGDPRVWITNSQLFKSSQETKIITTIECDTEPCNYDLHIVNQDEIGLEQGDQINYYVTDEFTETKFKFINIPNFGNTKMSIWAKGGMELSTNLGNQYETKNFYVINVEKDSYELTLRAKKGDYVNVGSLLFQENIALKNITVDESPVTLYLSKGILEKACLGIEMKNKTASPWVFGTGIIDSTVARGYVLKSNGEIEGSTEVFNYGYVNLYFIAEDIETKLVCFDFPSEPEYQNIREIILSFQLTSGQTLNQGLNIFQPQQNGILYPRYLNKGQKAAFIGYFPGENYKEINYNMLSISGFPKMSVIECEDYPLCLKFGGKNATVPHRVNGFTSYSVYRKELVGNYSPINFTQTLLMVECGDSKTGEKDASSEICVFGTLFYSDLNSIHLVENQYFNQYLLMNEKDSFVINFRGQVNIKQIYVDINVYSGEVQTNMLQLNGFQFKEYYNANKIYFIVTINERSDSKEVKFEVKSLKNAFYSIQYSLVRDGDDSNKKNNLGPESTYLITVNPRKQHQEYESQKIVSFVKNNPFSDYPFLVNFYSLNCRLQVRARRVLQDKTDWYIEIPSVDYFTQDLYTLEGDQETFRADSYDYNLTVVEEDFSDYENKRCMVYASAVELNPNRGLGGEIVIGENTVQQIMFKKGVIENITYLYPDVNQDSDLFILFNVIDKAKYQVIVYFETYDIPTEYELYKTENYKFSKEDIKNNCPEANEVCNIIISISLKETVIDPQPMLEVEVKNIASNSVTFLQKNTQRNEFIIEGNVHYYYTEVGQNEEGSITINFQRGEGKIYARLVSSNITTPEKDANWKGMYHFPTTSSESFDFDMYLKKIYYVTYDDQCKEGCYLLITVYSDIENDLQLGRVFPFSVIIHSAPYARTYSQIPTMSIKTENYVVGNVGFSPDERMYEFYEVWLNKDSKTVEIDFQSDAAGIFINVGETKPTTKDADFKFFPQGKDTILSLSREDILQKGKARSYKFPDEGILNSVLTIGIWSNSSDTVYTTVFSFLVHLSGNDAFNDLDIHKVNSDQKTLCLPKKTDDTEYPFRCLYVIESEAYNFINSLLVYATLQNNSIPYQLFAEEIDPLNYELGKIEEIKKSIPGKNAKYTTYNKADYLFLFEGLSDKYLLVSVVAKEQTVIELMSTYFAYDQKITPNPSTPQLLSVNGTLTLKLNGLDTFVINLISFEGEAELYWDKEPNVTYYLRGRDDRLSLPTVANSNLVIKDIGNLAVTKDNPGFAFYINYNVRFQGNLDEIYFGKSVNYGYTHTQLPIQLYAKLPELDNAINVFFTFYDLILESGKLSKEQITIEAAITSVNTIYQMRQNDAIRLTNLRPGIYDAGLKTGYIRLSSNDIKGFKIGKEQLPYLYVRIRGINGMLKRVNLEITAVQESTLVPTTEKVLQYGSVSNSTKIYKLRPNIAKPSMRIEFSSTDPKVEFTITKTPGKNESDFILKGKNKNGRNIYEIDAKPSENDYLYMNVKRTGSRRRQNDNFAFKYINYNASNLLNDYHVADSKITLSKTTINNSTNYELLFNSVPGSNKLNVTYIVKFVRGRRNFTIPDETIALTLGGTQISEFKNPKVEDGKVKVNVLVDSGEPNFIELYALIRDKSVNEVIAYQSIKLSDATEKSSSSVYKVVVSVVGIILLVAVLIVLGLIFWFKKQNKDLKDKVNKISFQEDRQDGKAGGLLYSDEHNALS